MTDEDRSEWWRESERLKRSLGLPEYDPPRFADDRYVHEVLEGLEAAYGCDIRFEAVDPRYPDDWGVAVDGEIAFSVGRRRTVDANTVYRMDTDEFLRRIEAYLGVGTDPDPENDAGADDTTRRE
jgi:hypothetical protein